jgi:2-oxoglutarate dehydrogenase E2 component (dihydrolipoamide succinyltransferase)
MPVDIHVPSVGESITEGTISRWLKANGSVVQVNDPLFELDTDKASQEVQAQNAGILTILVPEGTKVAIGSVVGRLQEGGTPAVTPDPKATESALVAQTKTPQRTPAAASPANEAGEPLLSPAARQLAADKAIDPASLAGAGTGRDGRIIKEDIQNLLDKGSAGRQGGEAPRLPAAEPVKTPASPPPVLNGNRRETRQRMSTVRQRIAERLLEAQQTAAILTTFNEADLSAVMALRARHKEAFQKKQGVGLGFMSFFVKAVVDALKAYPAVNASIDGSDIVHHHYYDIGVAVSTEKGLMVPVLRGADQLSFAGIEKGIAALAQKARDGKITVADLSGGTFTITNGGVFGSLLSTPILNPPQSAILGMHAIQKRPVVVDDQIVIRPMMYLAVSYDHRLIDGREAVSFLVRVKECIEAPERLLLEV